MLALMEPQLGVSVAVADPTQAGGARRERATEGEGRRGTVS